MTDSADVERKPLIWPTLFHDFEEPKEVIEHIELKTDVESIDALLFEIEFRHPHISSKLKLLLGHPEFEIEIRNLIVAEREGRAGFDKNILSYLLKLYHLHHEEYGFLSPVNIDLWELNRSR